MASRVSAVRAFDPSTDFTVGLGSKQQAYHRRADCVKKSIKWGQLKLLVAELEFFTRYWDEAQVPSPIVVYVGSATGTHIATLAKYFPSFSWELYDPNPHNPLLSKTPRVRIHQQFFTDDDAKHYAGRPDIFFITDLRTTSYLGGFERKLTEPQERANEALVQENMDQQARWYNLIQPVQASLKFRLPYLYKWVDRVQKPTRKYLDGLVYIQAWAPCTSTETRLVPTKGAPEREWNYAAHEEVMFNHNVETREKQTFLNPITASILPIAPSLGLTNDYDSTMTTVVVMDYLSKFKVEPSNANVLAVLEDLIAGANEGKTNLVGLRAGVKLAEADDDE